MRFQVTLPYESQRVYRNGEPAVMMVRPRVGDGLKVVKDVVDKHVVVSFEVKKDTTSFGHLTGFPGVITAKNVDAVLELVEHLLDATRVPNKYDLRVVTQLLVMKGWGLVEDNYDVLYDQEGWGYMGGTGCGTLIHKLRFNKILGVLPALTGVQRTLAAMQFNGWLGEVKAIRAERSHLRESVTEDELFVTLGAHPICQNTVAYVGARGFPVKAATEQHCSCTKCADKLGITASHKRNGIAITTPDTLVLGSLTFTYAKTTKTSAVLQVTTAAGKLVDRKALNAAIRERGRRLAYTGDPLAIRGIWYVEALKESTPDMLVLKMERGPKDAMFAQASILVNNNLLLEA